LRGRPEDSWRGVEEDSPLSDSEFTSTFPPNARVVSLRFEPGILLVELEDQEEVRVPCEQVTGLFGAGLSRESTRLVTERKFVDEERYGRLLGRSGMYTTRVRKQVTETVVNKEVQPVLALRVSGVLETWYLNSTSFNFRKALGPDMSYAVGMNLKTLIRRLAEHCPGAFQDDYIQASLNLEKPPAPLDGLMTFLNRIPADPTISPS